MKRLLLVFGVFLVAATAHSRPPNFVLIFTDDQRYGVGCFGLGPGNDLSDSCRRAAFVENPKLLSLVGQGEGN